MKSSASSTIKDRVVIVSGLRLPFAKQATAYRGSLRLSWGARLYKN